MRFKELQEPDFMFLVTGQESILGGPNFFEKEYVGNFLWPKWENMSHHVIKIYDMMAHDISYAFANRKK